MNMIEVVFEKVPRSQILALLSQFTKVNGSESILSELEMHQVYSGFSPEFVGEGFSIKDLHIRIIKFEANFDLEISFALGKQVELSGLTLCRYFVGLAHTYQVPQVYGGLEPASDFETRFFTGTELGPVDLNRFS